MMEMVLNLPGSGPVSVWLTGSSTEHVFFEGAREGGAADDDGDGLDDVDTELVQLDLVGASPLLGPVRATVSPTGPSTGMIEENINNTPGLLDVDPFAPGTADSFFDVFFEIELGGQPLNNWAPVRLDGLLTFKPAGHGDVYFGPGGVDLIDPAGSPTGITIGGVRYWPNPAVEIDVYTASRWYLDIATPLGTERVMMTGNSVMRVYFEGAREGSALDGDGDGLDDVNVLLAELVLSGTGETLGPVSVTLNGNLPSTGVIEERINNTNGTLDVPPFTAYGSADSFFDVFVEIEVGAETLHNEAPMRLGTIIGHKPPGPGTVYVGPRDIHLVDENGDPTGIVIGIPGYEPALPPTGCGDLLHPYPIGDLNGDCIVNELDLIILQWHWGECTQPGCE
jgi:hypothetical protein